MSEQFYPLDLFAHRMGVSRQTLAKYVYLSSRPKLRV